MRKSNQFHEYLKSTLMRYSLLMIVFIFALFFLCLYVIYQHSVVRANVKANENNVKSLEMNLQAIHDDLIALSENEKLMERLTTTTDSLRVNQDLYAYINATDYTDYFLIVDEHRNPISTNLYKPNQLRLENNFEFDKIIKQSSNRTQDVIQQINPILFEANQQSEYVMSKSIVKDGKVVGTMLLFIQSMQELIDTIHTDDIVITDRFDRIIFSSFSPLLINDEKFKFNNAKRNIQNVGNIPFHTVHQTLSNSSLQVITFNSIASFKKIVYLSGIMFLVLFFVFVAIIYYGVPKVSNRVMAPLNELLGGFRRFKGKNIVPKNEKKTFDEFQVVLDEFYLLTNKIENLLYRNKLIEESKRQLEIKHLESQFNPHFVYNTLETIRYEIGFNQENAEKMVVSLANLMRYSINQGPSEVHLKTEIKYVEDYLLLQKVRFGDRLKYTIHIETETEMLSVPKLIIQTLVENAIKHCMENTFCLIITINAMVHEESLIIKVEDNGQGISEEKLNQIHLTLQSSQYPKDNIGLFNSKKLIELLYGPMANMEISSEVSKGTAITLKLPVQGGLLHV